MEPWQDPNGTTMAEMAECQFCRFYHHGNGECRRRSPNHQLSYALGGGVGVIEYAWPYVGKNDFCGEFERGAALAIETLQQQKERD